MYKRILVALENSPADKALLPHVSQLARMAGSELVLFHVADGFAARNFDQLRLVESEEVRQDRAYLEERAAELRTQGLSVDVRLAMGNPPTEIIRAADAAACDLITMTSHGHRWLADLFLGSTIDAVRHGTHIPILVVRSPKP